MVDLLSMSVLSVRPGLLLPLRVFLLQRILMRRLLFLSSCMACTVEHFRMWRSVFDPSFVFGPMAFKPRFDPYQVPPISEASGAFDFVLTSSVSGF